MRQSFILKIIALLSLVFHGQLLLAKGMTVENVSGKHKQAHQWQLHYHVGAGSGPSKTLEIFENGFVILDQLEIQDFQRSEFKLENDINLNRVKLLKDLIARIPIEKSKGKTEAPGTPQEFVMVIEKGVTKNFDLKTIPKTEELEALTHEIEKLITETRKLARPFIPRQG